jgi:hypothetical protein
MKMKIASRNAIIIGTVRNQVPGPRSSRLRNAFRWNFLSDFESLRRALSVNVNFMCKCNVCVKKNVPDWRNLIKDAEFPI